MSETNVQRGRIYSESPSPWEVHANARPRRRVLVVDDSADNRETLVALLRMSGHEVRSASDGHQGIEIARLFQPDVIFLDLRMPELDGYEVCSRLRLSTVTAGARIYALTGYGTEGHLHRSAEVGFDGHLVKPLEPESLSHLIEEETTAVLLPDRLRR
jgi:two-component system, chemotaxis family, CheB/CheR fusion protein